MEIIVDYRLCIICFALGLVIGFSGGFGMGKKEVTFERGISLVMFTVWLVGLTIYGATDKDMPVLFNSVGAGSALALMGLNVGDFFKTQIKTKLGI